MQSSVADVVYEAKREARERRPGDRVADAFPAIAPKLEGGRASEKIARERGGVSGRSGDDVRGHVQRDAAEVLRLRRLAIASAFAEVVPIVTPERAERFAAALRSILDVEERLAKEAALDAALAAEGVTERPLSPEERALVDEENARLRRRRPRGPPRTRRGRRPRPRRGRGARAAEAEAARVAAEAEAARVAAEAEAEAARVAEEEAARAPPARPAIAEAERKRAEEDALARAENARREEEAARIVEQARLAAAARQAAAAARRKAEAVAAAPTVEVDDEAIPSLDEILASPTTTTTTTSEEDLETVVAESVVVVVDDDAAGPGAAAEAPGAVLDESGAAVPAEASAARLDGGDGLVIEAADAATEAVDEEPTAGDLLLRTLDTVLLISERLFSDILPNLVDAVALAASRAQKALADPAYDKPKRTELLGGVKSTLPDEDSAAGRARNAPKLAAPAGGGGHDDAPRAADGDDEPSS
ncbi:hypothetical protein JL721_5073 [Aureococcus anophagefferens]|nr:hypothetical protein JL721_5073 [Aureococcus anophagefferens]